MSRCGHVCVYLATFLNKNVRHKGRIMRFEDKKKRALEELRRTNIMKSNYAPPLLKLLWKIGIKAKPPHYNSFVINALPLGLYFAVGFGVLMWFIQWKAMPLGEVIAIALSIVAGIIFGVGIAIYYRISTKKNNLTSWESL
jgi:hypothetical protein